MATSKTVRNARKDVALAPNDESEQLVERARAQIASAAAAAQQAVRAGQGVLAAPSTGNLVSELNNIDFRKMIGGPLQAAVDAQVASSIASMNFINSVGFITKENGGAATKELVMVDFSHSRTGYDKDGKELKTEIKLQVPLLTMLQIPSLRIDHVEIAFNAKLNSVESASVSDDLKVGAEVSAGWGPVSMKVSVAYQRKTAQNVEVKKEYGLNVNVRAVQDEMPPGLERLLNLLAA